MYSVFFSRVDFCQVLPPSGYTVLSEASSFLLKWLFHYEHEHQQWSAAVSLGLVSNSLHITDKSRKADIINGLLEVRVHMIYFGDTCRLHTCLFIVHVIIQYKKRNASFLYEKGI